MKGSSLRRLGVILLTALLVAVTPVMSARAADTGAITGQLTFSDGRPAAAASVSVYRSSDSEWVGDDDTDDAGSYEIAGLPGLPRRFRSWPMCGTVGRSRKRLATRRRRCRACAGGPRLHPCGVR